jgi:hypothetical protein
MADKTIQPEERERQEGTKVIYIFRNMDALHGNGQCYVFKDANNYAKK